MGRLTLIAVTFLTLVGGTAETAYARRGIPIIWGNDDKLVDLGELPSDVAVKVTALIGHRPRVAFIYSRVHIFWLDVWTWNGRYVLANGNTVWEVPEEEMEAMVGEDPATKYGKPLLFAYHSSQRFLSQESLSGL